MKNSVDFPVCSLGSWDFYDFKGATDLHGENEGGDTGAPGEGARWNYQVEFPWSGCTWVRERLGGGRILHLEVSR